MCYEKVLRRHGLPAAERDCERRGAVERGDGLFVGKCALTMEEDGICARVDAVAYFRVIANDPGQAEFLASLRLMKGKSAVF